MKKLGLMGAMVSTWRSGKLPREERLALQERRLWELVAYAKEHSPYYKELYREVGPDFHLTDLPPTGKQALMTHFDDWCTDRTITLDEVNSFMESPDNIGRLMGGKYLVFTTSGSSGNPSIVLYDRTANSVASALAVLRSYARGEDMKAFLKRGKKSAGLFAANGFYLGYSTMRHQLLKMPFKKGQMMPLDVQAPMEETVARLNAFQPAMLGGYPTALSLLADEQNAGRLHISPVIIMTGGEYLADDVREKLSEAFGGYVQTNYSCTEGGSVAHECRKQHFHINEEWVIVEPVDRDNRPVPDGVQSAKLLLTSLSNYTQPLIRFEITDRIVLHHEPCGCGERAPWLEIEGRTDDILTFENGVRIPPLALYALLKELPGVRRFQLLQRSGDLLELRFLAIDKEYAFTQSKVVLEKYFQKHGVTAEYILSEEPPQSTSGGKFKHIVAKR